MSMNSKKMNRTRAGGNLMYRMRYAGNQRGIATLGITILLLFIVTLVTLYTAKTSIKEQQISANEYRADQSLSTANAALNWGVAHYTEARGFVCDERLIGVLTNYYQTCPPSVEDDRTALCTIKSDDVGKCVFAYTKASPLTLGAGLDDDDDGPDEDLSSGRSEMYFAFVDNGEGCDGDSDGLCNYIPVTGAIGETVVKNTTTPVYEAEIRIVGTGHSDDNTGMRTVIADMATSNLFGEPGLGASPYPLISKQTSKTNASIEVINRYGNRTIWTGDKMEISGSTDTYILEHGLSWNCNDILNHDKCVTSDKDGVDPSYTMRASSGQDNINADIVDGDPNLAISGDEFFHNFFGKSKDQVRKMAEEMGHLYTVDSSGNLSDTSGAQIGVWSDLEGKMPLVWLDLADGVSSYTPSGSDMDGTLGAETDPMVLIVDGNLSVGGVGSTSLILVGVLYVTGTWDASANAVVQGMLIVETLSNLGGGGTPTLIYDADLFNGKMGPEVGTVAGATPGSWKDWE